MQECKELLLDDKQRRDKVNVEFVKLVEERQKEIETLEKKYMTNIDSIW